MRCSCRSWLLIPAILMLLPQPGFSQEDLPDALSLQEALRIARARNPLLQADLNNREVSDWNVRASYASFIPSASVGTGLSWQGSGEQQFGSLTLSELGFTNQPSYYFSSYNLGINYTLNGQILMALPQAKADREAQIAQGSASESQTVLLVTQAYLEVLRQEEGLKLAERELERARGNLRLAQGQQEVGTGTPMDVRQAEVAVGRARVTLLTSQNGVRTAKFRLLQQMGIDPREGFSLSTTFDLVEPSWTEDQLTDLALERNPQLVGLRASLRTSQISTKMARSAYFPTLSFSAGVSGFTREASNPAFLVAQAQSSAISQVRQCQTLNDLYARLADPLPPQDCSAYLLTESQRQAIVAGNDNFPFNFRRNPPSASLALSLPVFQGLRRQRDLEAARIAEDDTRFQLRDQELRLKADLASGLSTLQTAYEAALIEEENQVWADEQLRLAQERYRVGIATFLELGEAETVKAQADRDLIAAIFAYHDALANLEALVGTSLRVP